MAKSKLFERFEQVKKQHPDSIVLIRLGDFYELFDDDAIKASEILELTLTGRWVDEGVRCQMCGFPYHCAEYYIQRLVKEFGSVAVLDGDEVKVKK